MRLRDALEVTGICIAMIGMSWVPESDIPKEVKEPIGESARLAVNYVEYITQEETTLQLAPEYINPFSKEVEPSNVTWEIEVAEEIYEEEAYDPEMVYLGAYDITAYEWTGYPCANGNYPAEGYTVACNSLPLGTVLYIDGIGYRTVEDKGADWHSDNWIDLYLGDVAECYEWGIRTRDVWIVN